MGGHIALQGALRGSFIGESVKDARKGQKMPNKSTLAKIAGWGQLAIEYINQVLQANGGLLPTSRAGWLRLLASVLMAGGIHHASNTSAGHPNG